MMAIDPTGTRTAWQSPDLFALRPTRWLAAATLAVLAPYVISLPAAGFGGTATATCLAVAFAALLSGIAGFAFSAICGAMLFQFRHDTVEVVQTLLVCSIANQSLSVWALRRDIRFAALVPFVAGGVAGVGAGLWLLLHLNTRAYIAGLGAFQLVYGTYALLRRPMVARNPAVVWDVLAGLAGGVLGGFAASPGAPVSIWCALKGWEKTRQRATFQPFILVMQIIALGLLAILLPRGAGEFTIPPIAWACVPASLAGTWWGLRCFQMINDRQFAIAVNLLLIASGLGLVV